VPSNSHELSELLARAIFAVGTGSEEELLVKEKAAVLLEEAARRAFMWWVRVRVRMRLMVCDVALGLESDNPSFT